MVDEKVPPSRRAQTKSWAHVAGVVTSTARQQPSAAIRVRIIYLRIHENGNRVYACPYPWAMLSALR